MIAISSNLPNSDSHGLALIAAVRNTPSMTEVAGSVPRSALLSAAAAIGLALVGAIYGTFTPHALPPVATAIAVRNLRFADGIDGSVKVDDARTGSAIATLAPGTNGFLRGTLRSLAGARRSRDQGAQLPFVLTAWNDGRLTLEDPADGRSIDLEAFGQTNVAAFAVLLTARETRR